MKKGTNWSIGDSVQVGTATGKITGWNHPAFEDRTGKLTTAVVRLDHNQSEITVPACDLNPINNPLLPTFAQGDPFSVHLAVKAILHVITMQDDAYLTGHPEWAHIVEDARSAYRVWARERGLDENEAMREAENLNLDQLGR
jgi:hypothetical protein